MRLHSARNIHPPTCPAPPPLGRPSSPLGRMFAPAPPGQSRPPMNCHHPRPPTGATVHQLTCNCSELGNALGEVLLIVIQPTRPPSLGLGGRSRAGPEPNILTPLIGGQPIRPACILLHHQDPVAAPTHSSTDSYQVILCKLQHNPVTRLAFGCCSSSSLLPSFLASLQRPHSTAEACSL